MISFIKKVLIQVTDVINTVIDPFHEFTRDIIRKSNESLASKAEKFEAQFKSDFLLPLGIYNYLKTYGTESPVIGDQALWHGIATSMLAFKYAVTKTNADAVILGSALSVMKLHYYGPKLYLIRGVTVDGGFADDASNDSLSGHFAGIYFGWKYGDTLCKSLAADIMGRLIRELKDNNNSLVKQDGTPTTYGKLINGALTDPLRASLCIGIYKAAAQILNNPELNKIADDLYKSYGSMLGYAKVKLLWWGKSYDTHRSAIHLTILADLLQGKEKENVVNGLKRLWSMEKKTADPWLMGLCARHEAVPREDIPHVVERLDEYEFDERGPIFERMNSRDALYWKDRGVEFFKWGGNLRATQPLPFWKMGSQDFFPQRDMFSVDNWEGCFDPRVRHSGLDFLASYWLTRLNGELGG
jgi:hypothetical protein